MLVLDGSGGGNSQVSTEVVISRDIWLKDREGQEHHVRVNQDIPLRDGQDIALIYASGEKKRGKFPANKQSGLMSIYVMSTNTSCPVRSLGNMATALARPYETSSMALGTLLAYGKGLEAEHQRLLNSYYSEYKKRLAAPQTSPQPQLQAREAT